MFTYLETYFKVFTELRAATEFAVQALVNKAVQLVGAVAAVVLMVTEQCLINTVSIVAGIRGVIAFLLCSMKERNEEKKKEKEKNEAMSKGHRVRLTLCQSQEIISVTTVESAF